MRRTRGLIAALALAGTACGGGASGSGVQRYPTKGVESRVVVSPVQELRPGGPAVMRYNDPVIAPAPESPLADAVVAAVHDAARSVGKTPPLPDGRLFAAAEELSRVAPEDGPVAYGLVEFAMQWHGIIEPSPRLVMFWGTDDADAIAAQLEERLPEILNNGQFTRLGVGSARRGDDKSVTILALQSSAVETDPIPRSLPTGGTFVVRGRVAAPFHEPMLFITREDGEVVKPAVARSGAGQFSARVSCDDRRGKQQVEITASDASGSTVMANFPVWCNEPAPTRIVIEDDPDDARPVTDPERAAERMLELINRDRAQAGLAPLESDSEVSDVARRHSEDMHRTGIVAHVTPDTGSALDRVRAGGIRTPVVLENLARAYSLGEAQEGLMNSPGHRANIVSPQATHVGIGVVLGQSVAGRRELFITQLFIRKAPAVDLDDTRRRAGEAIARVRKVQTSAALTRIASSYAQALARGESLQVITRRSAERLQALSVQFSAVKTVVLTVAEIDEFDPTQPLADTSWRHYGLGVAQGSHPDIGDGAVFVVLLLARD